MSALSQPIVSGDWLKFEEDNRYCREVGTVIAPVDLPSGQVLGVGSTWTTRYQRYDNAGTANLNAADASAILIEPIFADNPVMEVTSITNANPVGTIVFPKPHGLAVGDIVLISGATVDTDLNGQKIVLAITTDKIATITTASVTDQAYTEATLRVTKINHEAALLVRGPAIVNYDNVDWYTCDTTGISAGKAQLVALGIVSQEAA